jgi:hypothetical protein
METRDNALAATSEKVNCRAVKPENRVKAPVIKTIKPLRRFHLDSGAPKIPKN